MYRCAHPDWDTGVTARSSTFRPHSEMPLGSVPSLVWCNAWYGSTKVYSNHSSDAATSKCLVIIFGRIANGVSRLLRSTVVSMQLVQPVIGCLHYVSHVRWMGLLLAIDTLGTIRPEDSGATFEQKNRITGRLGMSGGKSTGHDRNSFIGRVKENTLINPPYPITTPSRHHLYIIHVIKRLHCFYRITLSLKWPLVL